MALKLKNSTGTEKIVSNKTVPANTMPDYNDDSITRLTGLEHVRMRSSMYIKSAHTIASQLQILKEPLDNASDESIHPHHRYTIKVVLFRNRTGRYQVMIVDQGRGVPVRSMKDIFTEMYTSGKFSGNSYVASTGTFGVGIKSTVAVCDRFVAISKRHDGLGLLEVCKGIIKQYRIEKPVDKDPSTVGTIVFYEPDKSILTARDEFMDGGGVDEVLKLIEWHSVYNANTEYEVYVVHKLIPDNFFQQPDTADIWRYLKHYEFTSDEKVFSNDKEMTSLKYVMKQFGLTREQAGTSIVWQLPILKKQITHDDELVGYFIELFMVKDVRKFTGGLVASVNMTPIADAESSHVLVLNQVIKSHIAPLILDKALQSYFLTSYKLPLYGSVMTKYRHYQPEGHTKDSFKDPVFVQIYTKLLTEELQVVDELTWENCYDLIQDDLVDKYTRVVNRDLQLGQGLKNLTFKLKNIGTFLDCISHDNSITEIFITEGTSAGTQVKDARDTNTQAIFIARGKPMNILRSDSNKMYQNRVIKDLVRVLNVSPDAKDLSGMSFRRIGLLADADSHGYHIVALFLEILRRINPLIISEGRVFVVLPPLYDMKAKQTVCYLRDYRALMDTKIRLIYSQAMTIHVKHFDRNYMVELKDEAFRTFCYWVDRVGHTINRVAKSLNVDRDILEQLLYCFEHLNPANMDIDKVRECLDYDRVIYDQRLDSIILVAGGEEINIPLTRLYDEIKVYVIPELHPVDIKKLQIFVTGKYSKMYYNNTPFSIMGLYYLLHDELDKLFPVSRMKGLGAMTVEALAETCMNPQTRSITTITDVGDIDRIEAWMCINTKVRKELIQNSMEVFSSENE